MNTSRRTLILGLVAASLLLVGCAAGPRDIRPAAVMDGVTSEEERKGRALLDRAAENAGGKDLLLRYAGFRTEINDIGKNRFGQLQFLRYAPEQRIQIGAERGTPSVTAVAPVTQYAFDQEENAIYSTPPDEGPVFADQQVAMPYVSNPPAMVVLPLKLAYADKVAYAGQVEFQGQTYERVFVTWDSLEPTRAVDQWLVWIDPGTGNIAKARSTLRDAPGAAESILKLENYRQFGDVKVPTTIQALRSVDDVNPIRTWVVDTFQWTDGGVLR